MKLPPPPCAVLLVLFTSFTHLVPKILGVPPTYGHHKIQPKSFEPPKNPFSVDAHVLLLHLEGQKGMLITKNKAKLRGKDPKNSCQFGAGVPPRRYRHCWLGTLLVGWGYTHLPPLTNNQPTAGNRSLLLKLVGLDHPRTDGMDTWFLNFKHGRKYMVLTGVITNPTFWSCFTPCNTVDGRNPANHLGCIKPYKIIMG